MRQKVLQHHYYVCTYDHISKLVKKLLHPNLFSFNTLIVCFFLKRIARFDNFSEENIAYPTPGVLLRGLLWIYRYRPFITEVILYLPAGDEWFKKRNRCYCTDLWCFTALAWLVYRQWVLYSSIATGRDPLSANIFIILISNHRCCLKREELCNRVIQSLS